MTQTLLPLAGAADIETELRERCPLFEIRAFKETRNGFDFKVIEGSRGAVTIRADRAFWSQAKREFIEKYDAEVGS